MIHLTKIRDIIAIATCRLLTFAGRLLGRLSTSAPGGVALKISPGILKRLSQKIKGPVIMVCGTNGKTTTNNLLYSLFSSQGKKCVCNNIGANMLPGVAWAFISKASLFGSLKADCACIECDEASLRRVVPHVRPDYIVVTNLFRDQLDRYGEIDKTIDMLNEGISMLGDVTLVLNADDPLSARLKGDKKCVWYGVDENCNINLNETKEGRFCPICHAELSYNFYHYSQLGDYYCPKCSFKRPHPDYSAAKVDLTDGIAFEITGPDISTNLKLGYRGFYNIYNVLASVALYFECGYTQEGIADVFNSYKPQIARMEPFEINSKTVILNLAKNPAGFNQAISTLASDPRKKDIFIAINDGAGDGKDVSWLWDVDFEKLSGVNAGKIVASGIRKYDMALRLKYGGIENAEAADNTKEALEKIVNADGEVCYVLVNYTAMFSAHDSLKALSQEGRKKK